MIAKPDAKEILFKSLEDLMKDKNIEHITVQQIIDNCHMSRSTFYRHFKDKYDLMVWAYIEEFKRITLYDVDSYQEVAYRLIEFLYTKKEFFMNISELEIQNSFREIMYQYAYRYAQSYFKGILKSTVLSQEHILSIQFCCAGTVFLILDWLRRGCDIPVSKFSKLLCDNMPHNLTVTDQKAKNNNFF